MEIITGEPRKRRSEEEKLAILAEAISTGNVTQTARRHGVNPSMLFAWRKQFGVAPSPNALQPDFMPVLLNDEATPSPQRPVIEIECKSGIRMRIQNGVDAALAAAVAGALAQK